MTSSNYERWGVMAALVTLTACGGLGPLDGPREELERARELWEEYEPANYSYAVRRFCFCATEAIGPVRVVVSNGIVVEARYVATTDTVPTSYRSLFPTVAGLFDILEDAYDSDASDVDVTYDTNTGVPTEFFIDYIENAVDDEVGYEVTAQVGVEAGN